MIGKKFYYDDNEGEGLSPETSHPNFVKNMTAAFYYDCTDDFSPFGNDDGADLLNNLEEFYQDTKDKDILKWLFNMIDDFGFKYKSEHCSKILDENVLKQIQYEDPNFLECMDNTIIATAFGQYKISGELDKDLKELALTAISRQLLLGQDSMEEFINNFTIMKTDLLKVN